MIRMAKSESLINKLLPSNKTYKKAKKNYSTTNQELMDYGSISDNPLFAQGVGIIGDLGKFDPKYQGIANDVYNDLANFGDFEYNLSGDPLYQQYADQYKSLGKLAMQDTIGQAAALTGGYASSYAQTAGQQAYNQHLSELNNMIPELYNLALNNYNSKLGRLQGLYDAAVQGYNMEANTYNTNLGYGTSLIDAGYNQFTADLDRLSTRNTATLNELSRIEGLLGTGATYYQAQEIADAENKAKETVAYYDYLGKLADASADADPTWFYDPNVTFDVKYDDDGDIVSYTYTLPNGEKRTTVAGENPFSETTNKDAWGKNGELTTFKNGFQPNNIGGNRVWEYINPTKNPSDGSTIPTKLLYYYEDAPKGAPKYEELQVYMSQEHDENGEKIYNPQYFVYDVYKNKYVKINIKKISQYNPKNKYTKEELEEFFTPVVGFTPDEID
jgi:hypothetical protein